jgi:hypothetical protein
MLQEFSEYVGRKIGFLNLVYTNNDGEYRLDNAPSHWKLPHDASLVKFNHILTADGPELTRAKAAAAYSQALATASAEKLRQTTMLLEHTQQHMKQQLLKEQKANAFACHLSYAYSMAVIFIIYDPHT